MVKSKKTTQFLDLPLTENGTFAFRNVVFYDSASVFAQGRNKRNKHTIQFDVTFPYFSVPRIDKSTLEQLKFSTQIPVSIYRKRYLNEMKLLEFYPNRRNILLDDIDVKDSDIENNKAGDK